MDILEFVTDDGKNVFRSWLDRLDAIAKAKVQARIFRIECGNMGDTRHLGDSLLEARIDFGPGYRIYFSEIVTGRLILLLGGGDKRTQHKDIEIARQRLKKYQERKK